MPSVLQPLSVAVHSNQVEAVDQLCTSSLGCGGPDYRWLLLLVFTSLLALVVIVAAVHVREARATVTEEQSRTAAERRAFAGFARRVGKLDVAGPTVQLIPATGSTSAVSTTVSAPDHGLDQVREAYRDTVLAMAHYEEEYDEPLARHMREELGEEVATAVEQHQQLTPALKRALVERSREAARERERLMGRLDHELDALEAADEELSAVSDAIDEAAGRSLVDWNFIRLADEWNRLGELESRLSRLLSRRQEALQASEADRRATDRPTLNEYLYEGLDTTYPVLADTSSLVDRAKDVRRRVFVELTRRA